MSTSQRFSCFLCGGSDLVLSSYLSLNSDSVIRNVGYLLPTLVGKALSGVSAKFASTYKPIAVNKRYFDRHLLFCRNCATGCAHPFFTKESLSTYYKEFYWTNRDLNEGKHLPADNKPNTVQLNLSEERLAWINKFGLSYSSVMDFGAGDCAASYAFLKSGASSSVHVVDPSDRAQRLATMYGASYSEDLAQAPMVDLIYSAHSIEHVHDLLDAMRRLTSRLRKGGCIFLETPNIGDEFVFRSLVHTPHTFMLSKGSIHHLARIMQLNIIAMECTGPRWKDGRPKLESHEKADLRVILQKPMAN